MAMAGELSVPNPKAIGRSTAKRGGGVKLQSYNDDLRKSALLSDDHEVNAA